MGSDSHLFQKEIDMPEVVDAVISLVGVGKNVESQVHQILDSLGFNILPQIDDEFCGVLVTNDSDKAKTCATYTSSKVIFLAAPCWCVLEISQSLRGQIVICKPTEFLVTARTFAPDQINWRKVPKRAD